MAHYSLMNMKGGANFDSAEPLMNQLWDEYTSQFYFSLL